MKRTIDVLLGDGLQVGTLRYDLQGRRESTAFEYGAAWLATPRVLPWNRRFRSK